MRLLIVFSELYSQFLILLTFFNYIQSIVFHPSVSKLELPLAPYNVKIFCQSGLASKNKSGLEPVLCPSASTTCGYFGIPINGPDNKTIIYECIDSSVFMTEDEEGSKDLCSHQSRCHKMPLIRLNLQFLSYLEQTYQIDLKNLLDSSESIKFCCSINHKSLTQLVNSNKSLLSINSAQVTCGDRQCLPGAVGCMSHKKEKKFDDPVPTLHSHDYIDVKPVQIIWQEEDDLIDDYTTSSSNIMEKDSNDDDHLHCVYPHFNDEIYRYCLMIQAQNIGNHCWTTRGHRICCCLLGKGQESCIPVINSTIITTTTQSTSIVMPKGRTTVRRKTAKLQNRQKKCQNSSMEEESKGKNAKSNTYKSRDRTICIDQPISKSTGNNYYLFVISFPLIIILQ